MASERADCVTDTVEGERIADLRAAAMLRDGGMAPLDARIERALAAIAAEMNLSRVDLIRMALTEWIEMRENARSSVDADTRPCATGIGRSGDPE